MGRAFCGAGAVEIVDDGRDVVDLVDDRVARWSGLGGSTWCGCGTGAWKSD